MAGTLLSWAGETSHVSPCGAVDEWWKRDGGMSTIDNDIWIFGDTYRFLASNHNSLVSASQGTTWTKGGVEQGTGTTSGRNFPGVGLASSTDLRWPTGVTLHNGNPFVTFARVDPTNGNAVFGWGYSDNGSVTVFSETGGLAQWGSPRVDENGDIWVYRTQTLGEGGKVLKKRITEATSLAVVADMPPWGLEMYTQWGDRQSFCARNVSTYYEIYRSYDKVHWDLVATINGIDAGSRNVHAHMMNYGVLVTWYNGVLEHMVRTLIVLGHEVPLPADGNITARNSKGNPKTYASIGAINSYI